MDTKKCKKCLSDIPKKATRCSKCQADQRSWIGRHPFLTIVIVFLLLMLLSIIAAAGGNKSQSSVSSPTTAPVLPAKAAPTISKAAARQQLDEFMALSKKAEVVRSYEFSDTARVIYADSAWYTQDVQFKKNFLAKVSSLLVPIYNPTGTWEFFQVHDAYSDEKIAEVTAFSGSLEVYK